MFLQQALPSANVVWGKVIFSQACVIPSVQGGGRAWQKRWPLKRAVRILVKDAFINMLALSINVYFKHSFIFLAFINLLVLNIDVCYRKGNVFTSVSRILSTGWGGACMSGGVGCVWWGGGGHL